jgi:hypothetical protein
VAESKRQRFIEWQAKILDEFARLAPGEDELLASFSQLAMETYDTLTQQGVRFVPWLSTWPESAAFFLRPGHPTDEVPQSCLEKWRQWELDYHELVARNPRLELRNLMQEISESMDASSWPQGYEWAIENWVAGGDPDRNAFGDHVLFERLSVLHTKLGGWLYLDDDCNIVFENLAEFRETRRRLDEERDERIQEEKERYEAAMQRLRVDTSNANLSGRGVEIRVIRLDKPRQ